MARQSDDIKIWKANNSFALGIEFQMKEDMDLSGFQMNINFGSIICRATFSAYYSVPYFRKIIATHWIRTQRVFIPYCTFPQSVIDLITNFTGSGSRDRFKQMRCIQLDRDYSDTGRTLFTSKEHPIIRLNSRAIYKLAFPISDNFYCDNYIGLNQKWRIHKNLRHIQFRKMNPCEYRIRKTRRRRKSTGESTMYLSKASNAAWFPSITYVEAPHK